MASMLSIIEGGELKIKILCSQRVFDVSGGDPRQGVAPFFGKPVSYRGLVADLVVNISACEIDLG